MENKFKSWFRFSKKERNAAIVLLLLVALVLGLPYVNRFFHAGKPETMPTSLSEEKGMADSAKDSGSLFLFDPNSLDKAGWEKLGLREKTIQTLLHYREKGGFFHYPEDLRKIYGLRSEEADRLIPYVRIAGTKQPASGDANSFLSVATPLDINNADITQWAALPGIGPVLSARIVKFRTAVGGFKSIDQVGKTYGLSDKTFASIRPYLRLNKIAYAPMNEKDIAQLTEKKAVSETLHTSRKININKATEEELLSARAIPRSLAKAIVIYREQHGPYSQLEDIKNIAFVNNDLYTKVSPYLKVGE